MQTNWYIERRTLQEKKIELLLERKDDFQVSSIAYGHCDGIIAPIIQRNSLAILHRSGENMENFERLPSPKRRKPEICSFWYA